MAGRFEEAIVILRNMLAARRVGGSPESRAYILSELGFTYAEVGNIVAAVRELNAAASLVEGLASPSEYLSQLAVHWRHIRVLAGWQGGPRGGRGGSSRVRQRRADPPRNTCKSGDITPPRREMG